MDGFLGYLLTQLWEELLVVLLLWLPLLVLAGMCVATLDKLEPRRRRGLFPLFVVMLALAAVLFGGAAVLGRYGLVWRTWAQESLAALLWLAGLSTGSLTVAYGGRWLREWRAGWGRVAVCLSGLCLASAMLFGTVLGGLWCLGPGEQVVTYRGQKAVLGKWVWMETSYQLYAYHGPLVRGAGPLEADWDESLVEGAVNVPWDTPW